MSQKKTNPAAPWLRWFVTGPLGPLGRKLGFRWVFFFTMPIPFHPLLFPALLLVLLGWSAWAGVRAVSGLGGGDASWAAMLAIGLALAVPMSVPIVAWVMMAFRAQLLQGLLFALSMALLALEVTRGGIAAPWIVLPAAYFGLFAVQALLGPAWLGHLRRQNDRFAPLPAGQTSVALAGFDWIARDLIEQCAVPRLYAPPLKGTVKAKAFHWLAPADAAALRAAMPFANMPGWKFEDGAGHVLLVREKARRPRTAITIRTGRYPAPAWLVAGLNRIEARGAGVLRRRTFGKPALVGWLPLFMLFHWTALVGRSEWVIGFPRRTRPDLAPPDEANGRHVLTLFSPRDADGGPFDTDGLPALYAEITAREAKLARQRDQAVADLPRFWRTIATDGAARRLPETMAALLREPSLLKTENVPVVLDWLERERDMPRMQGVHAAARLLAAFPDELLAPNAERLGRVFNSQKLALQWDLHRVEDRTVLPKDAPLFAGSIVGFGLYLMLPGLYTRLATICPDLKNVERSLKREMAAQSGIRDSIAVVFSGGFATTRKRTPRPSP
ncbi:MAG: hypothetical protein ACKOQ3_13530 [Novosphingobium sp.]